MRQTPIAIVPRPSLYAGDRVKLAATKQRWTVRGVTTGGRFVILTKPFNVRHTVLYTVVDFERGVRGKDNFYGLGYETDEQVADALHMFQHAEDDERGMTECDGAFCVGSADVSFRSGNHVRLDFESINDKATDWAGRTTAKGA